MGEDVAIVTVFFVAPKFTVFIAQMPPTSIALAKVIDAVFAVSGFAIFTLFEGKVCSVRPTIIAFRHIHGIPTTLINFFSMGRYDSSQVILAVIGMPTTIWGDKGAAFIT
jgi:hypothetical protein